MEQLVALGILSISLVSVCILVMLCILREQVRGLRKELKEELGKSVARQIFDTPLKDQVQSGTEYESKPAGRKTMWD